MHGNTRRFAVAAAGLILSVTAVAWAKATSALDPPALPAPGWHGVLARPVPEAPAPLDPQADLDRCAVCRLSARTMAALPPGTFRMEPTVLDNGAALRLVSGDPPVRDALWKVTLERGELLVAMRAGADVHLCAQCRARRELLDQMEISARRIPEGVLLVYTSSSASIVRQIHTLIRTGIAAGSSF
jgi:hypothetical protein